MARSPRATMRRSGDMRVTLRIRHDLSYQQLRTVILHYLETYSDAGEVQIRTIAEWRAAIDNELSYRGNDMFIDGTSHDDDPEFLAIADDVMALVFPTLPKPENLT